MHDTTEVAKAKILSSRVKLRYLKVDWLSLGQDTGVVIAEKEKETRERERKKREEKK